ncbi:MAG: T9SS type A sorting domain-containing protein [candidate division Zixibacteria bacterium]|nr:T9SS type A sorting domain-containing protein [candidate division Zixibacteria bacterium]
MRFATVLAFVLVVPFAGSSSAINLDCDTIKVTSHFTLIFEGVTYDTVASTSKWDYSLRWDGQPPELSYFFIELCSLITEQNLVAAEPSLGTIGKNGNLKLWGIKWDDIENFPADTSFTFSFTLDQLLALDHTQFAPKAGVNKNIATICGPSVFCEGLDDQCIGNIPPAAYCPADTSIFLCELQEVCLTGFGATDPDNNLATIEISGGVLSGDTVCFVPVEGANTITLIATDSCGKADTCITIVTVSLGQPPFITASPPTEINLCLPETICVNFAAGDPNNDIDSIWTSFGEIIDNDKVCFQADSSGVYQIVLSVVDSCGLSAVDSFEIFININEPPVIVDIDTTDSYFCEGANQVCVKLTIDNPNGGLTGSSNLGVFNASDSTVCFYVDSSGRYCDYVIITNSCGLSDTISYCIDVVVNYPPVAVCPPNDTITSCAPGQICLPGFFATDQDGNIADITVVGGSLSGDTVCFNPIQGDNVITLIVTDSCGLSDTCTTIITVINNGSPLEVIIAMPDTTIYLCQPSYVCLPLEIGYDNISLPDSSITVNIGQYENGFVCFVPYDSGNYTIIATATDSCGNIVADSAVVRILTDQFVDLACPPDTLIFICQPETLCFPLGNIPEWADIQVSGIATWYDAENNQVCFYAECGVRNRIIVKAITPCDTISCEFTVDVVCNLAPLVFLPGDSSISLCMADTVGIPVGITDPNGNISSIELPDWASYDEFAGLILFMADTSGLYEIIVTVTDSCQASRADRILVSITIDEPPICQLPSDTSFFICGPAEITLPISAYDIDQSDPVCTVISGAGSIVDGYWVYQADSNAILDVVIECRDNCDNVCIDSFRVVIDINEAPVCDVPSDTVFNLCDVTEICLPIFGTDADGNLIDCEIVSGPGSLAGATGKNAIASQLSSNTTSLLWCYTPTNDTTFEVVIRCTDSCGAFCEDSFTVTINLNEAPLVDLPADTNIFLCSPDSVSIPIVISDTEDNITSIELPVWTIYDELSGLLTFYADTSGVYEIYVRATDSCELFSEDTIVVTVAVDEPPVCQLPSDTSFFICAPTEISLPVAAFDNDDLQPACSVVSGPGTVIDGNWVYQADSDAVFDVVIECQDACGNSCVDSFRVTIDLNEAPVCDVPSDTVFNLCDVTEICLPIFGTDADGNLIGCEIVSGPGSLAGATGKNAIASQLSSNTTSLLWCYTPSNDTTFEVVIRCTDSCGAFCESSFNVTINLNQAPEVFCPADTSMLLCNLSEIFLTGFTATDINGDELTLSVDLGLLSGDTLFFTPVVGENLITFIATDSCGISDTCQTLVIVDTNSAPVCDLIGDTTITSCVTEQICLPVGGSDIDGNLISCEIVSGPGVIENGFWCYTPQANDTVDVTFRCTDECGEFCESSFRVIIDAGVAPTIADQFFSFKYCAEAFNRELNIFATNDSADPTIFELLSGAGSVDSLSGIITYLPDTPGVYSFEVAASNSCGSDTALISDSVIINRPPEIIGFDSTIYLCGSEEICFDVFAFDPDGDSLEIILSQGPGQFTQLTDNSGKQCFTPSDVDSATYLFVYQVSDLCQDGVNRQSNLTETISITVIINQAPVISCPTEQIDVLSCGSDTVCFEVSAIDPDGDSLTFEVISGNATANGNIICFVADSAGQFEVTISCIDSCLNSDTCSVIINVELNAPPDILLGDDFAVEGCTEQEICFGLSTSDPDNNLDVIFSNIGVVIGQDSLCFMADSSGVYQIIVTAVDSCGAVDVDTINVTVTLNTPPIVSLGPDTTREICPGDSVCLFVTIEDDNISSVSSNYQLTNNVVCFSADTAGIYEVWVSAVDSCGVEAADTVYVTVTFPPAPFVELGEDFAAAICEPTQFCIDPDTIANFNSITVNYGQFDPLTNLFCVTIDSSISDYLIVEITDSCGRVARDSLWFDIILNTAPVVEVSMPDTTVYLCGPAYICLPLLFSDFEEQFADGDISVNYGNYSNGEICFVPYDSGTYTIIASVTDSCGKIAADTAIVTVLTDQFIDLSCPNDTSIFICQPETLCFPLGNIPVWADISVSGIATWYDAENNQVCFYAECGVRNLIIVRAVTPCDTIICQFTVNVVCNQAPVVHLPGDTTFVLCGPDLVSFPVAIGDPDNNIVSINTDSWVSYEPFSSLLSFAADTEGVYILQVSATDSCGAQSSAQITVTVFINEAPEISFAVSDSVYVICVFGEICLPLDIFDRENNIVSVVPSLGYFDSENQQICFTPTDTVGLYCIDVIATDSCGLADTTTKCISIENDQAIGLDCPLDTLISSLCFPGLVSRFIDISGQPDSIITSIGYFDESEIFFSADTSGFYTIDLSVYSSCSTLTCQLYFDVTIVDSVFISCPADDSVTICGPDTLCYPIIKSNSVQSLSVTAPAFISGDLVCLPVSEAGTYNLTIIGIGACGADTCDFSIRVEANSPPVLVSAPDTTYDVCEIPEICVPFTVTDADNNIDSVVGPDGILTGNEYCFTPPAQGLYNLIFTAYDSCGAIGSDTTAIRISISVANITCPSGTQSRTICIGDSATVSVLITPFDATVTVYLNGELNGYYNHDLGLVVVFPEVSGAHDVMVAAEATCNTDSCLFVLNATVLEPPVISCPIQIDTSICLNDGNFICFPVSVTGSGVELSVSDNAVLTDSTVCVAVSQNGTIQVITYAQGTCGIDSCITTINVNVDEPPLLTLPQAVVVERCDFDTGQICIPGIFATDDSLLNITKICGPGTLELASLDSGQICFEPDENVFGTYTFCIQVDDGCNQVVDSFTVEVVLGPDCDKCVVLVIDPGECIPVGRTHDVFINIETNRAIGGFDLLVGYDATVTSFSNATKEGTEIESWEFFTYRLNSASCGSACPSGTIRFIGIADISNGADHPPDEALSPNGRFIKITFQVSNDQNISGLFLPINFIWFDCSDNTFGNPSGNELFIDNKIYNGEGILIWDEEDSISFPESSRPQGMGTPDSCIGPEAEVAPRRCVEFFNGGICILDQVSFNDRGDINLNSVPYEVADAIVFTNYFIYGLRVFTINVAAQIAATDINADGIPLSVADLVLLIRIILGDADPIPKLNSHDQELLLQLVRNKDGLVISSNSSNGIGGAYLVFKLNSSETNVVPELATDAEHMDLRYHIADDELRILVFSMNGNTIESGNRQLIKLTFVSGQQPELIKSEFADGDGRPYKSSSTEIELPTDFELYQNYPNPFNPSTNISFYLPDQSDWKINIYNVNGSLVRQISGSNETGMVEVLWDGASQTGNQVASGVYFYRLEAGDFKRTRKMMMLK